MGYVYIMTNKNNRVLYIGVTTDLVRRVSEHRTAVGVALQSNIIATSSYTMKYSMRLR
ncbi:MAG: GIY-YIG nuclease family protein, partial [Bacteroidales bacterium]|nr:GIY-YIG nuclease family protein [Bacteroidales bacterium]